MIKALGQMDKKAKNFLFLFLHIICVSSFGILLYGAYIAKFGSAYDMVLLSHNGALTVEYLLLSLCESIGGALLLDFVSRKSGLVNE